MNYEPGRAQSRPGQPKQSIGQSGRMEINMLKESTNNVDHNLIKLHAISWRINISNQ